MATATRGTVELLDPTCEAHPEVKPLAERLATLAGKRLALLDNTKPNVGPFYELLREALLARVPFAAVTVYRKRDAASPASDEVERAIVAEADAVINAMADWGACTSWSVHDSVRLEERGLPVATITTTEFALLAHGEAEALGIAGLPLVVISHHFSDLRPEELPGRVAEAVEQILHALATPRDVLEREFGTRDYQQPRATVRAKALFA